MKKICLLFGIILLLFTVNIVFAEPYQHTNQSFNKNINTEPDFSPYMRDLQRRIKMNWEPPKGRESLRVVLLFKLAKNGNLLSSSVYKSSGDKQADKAALDALLNSMPFKPLPAEFKGKSVDIQFTFDYNVFGNNISNNVNYGSSLIPNKLAATPQKYITYHNGYKFLNIIEETSLEDFLLKSKVDCKNRLIGIKKSYLGPKIVYRDYKSIYTSNLIFYDNVKMQSPDNDDIYLKIYNYACQP